MPSTPHTLRPIAYRREPPSASRISRAVASLKSIWSPSAADAAMVEGDAEISAPLVETPAHKGRAAVVPQGAHIKVVNTHGEQVVDTCAFNCSEPANPCRWNTSGHTPCRS